MKRVLFFFLSVATTIACEQLEYKVVIPEPDQEVQFTLDEVAKIISQLPITGDQMQEVYDAVSLSVSNGYDDEYTMANLFETPGAGVGDRSTRASYQTPFKELFRDFFNSQSTKAASYDAQTCIEALQSSDIQIYWPYFENWSQKGVLPIITFDPEDGSSSNIGYRLLADGSVEEIMVTEDIAVIEPVWVINRNDDRDFDSLEMLRKSNPQIKDEDYIRIGQPATREQTKAPTHDVRTLVLKDITVLRQFDSWFAGASEFFVKCGAVEDFTASTEAELKLYDPSITDFMVVIRRNKVKTSVPFNVVLVSEWTEQLDKCAFMIIEDDGGERTSWKAESVVKVNSKSYGINVSLPFRTRDDIVWRGQLAYNYLEKYCNTKVRLGDVELTFDII